MLSVGPGVAFLLCPNVQCAYRFCSVKISLLPQELRGKMTEAEETETKREISHPLVHCPQMPTPTRTRSEQSHSPIQVGHVSDRGPSIRAITCCLPRRVHRELDWKWKTWDLNPCSCLMAQPPNQHVCSVPVSWSGDLPERRQEPEQSSPGLMNGTTGVGLQLWSGLVVCCLSG